MAGWLGYLKTGSAFPPSETVIIESLLGAKDEADAERRQEASRRVSLFQDDWKSQLIGKLSQQYEFENFTELHKTLDLSNNVCKKIITDISTIYDEPAAWKLAKDDGGAWKTVRKNSNLELIEPLVNQYTNLCNACFVRPAVINGRVRYHVITPDLLKVWQCPEDQTQIDAFAYYQGMVNTPDRLPIWHYWSNGGEGGDVKDAGRAMHRILDSKGAILYETENPYRDQYGNAVLPVAVSHKNHPISKFWDQTSGHDIVDGTLMIGAQETMINFLFRADSAQLKYIVGEVEGSGSQVAGPTRFMTFRAKGDLAVAVGQFKSQADWDGLRKVINDKIANLSTNYGLSPGALQIEGTPQSGFALKVRKEPLLEMRKRQIPLYRTFDRDLYAVTAAVWNHERGNVAGDEEQLGTPAIGKPMLWLEDADPEITYGHFEEPMTASEQETDLSLRQARLSMGLTNVIELYQEEHPDTTEEDARAAIEENNKINRELASGTQLVVGRAQILQVTPAKAGEAPVEPAMTADGTTNQPPDGLAPG